MSRLLSSLASTTLVALTAVGASAQSVSDIVDQMYDAYEAQAAGVDNYTLVQTAMGMASTMYFEKEMVDGHPVFVSQGGSAQGANMNFGLGNQNGAMGDVYSIGPQLVEHATYEGRESIDGVSVHVLAIDDLSQLPVVQDAAPNEMEFKAKNGKIYVDAELMVPRRIEFVGDATTPNGVHEVTIHIDQNDIRDVQGLLVPYHTTMQISGLQAMIDPEMRAQLEEMEQQLAALPPEQREMMERMMGDQLEQLRQMAAGDSDAMSVEVTVDDVRVNAGPPSNE
ncbi:MAG: hypothetical protein PVJ80_01075 [Gemmatimonadota bacterium]|jgi:hypothetical protein